MFLGIPTDESTTALITKYESDFLGTVELNKISTEVLESSLIEIISIGLGAAFAGVVIDLVTDKRATIEIASRAAENTSVNNLRTYLHRSPRELSKAPAKLARVIDKPTLCEVRTVKPLCVYGYECTSEDCGL
jgi:hypothetical protein